MNLSDALEGAVILASIAVVVLVACIVPMAFHLRRRLEHLALSADRLTTSMESLVRDGHEMARMVNEFAHRANGQLDEASHLTRTVRKWTDRADRLAEGVGLAGDHPCTRSRGTRIAFEREQLRS